MRSTALMPILRARGLTKSFSNIRVLSDVSFSLASGELVAILGPSGSGKTTLFRCLARLIEPDAGEIFVGHCAYHTLGGAQLAAARRDIGLAFQQFNLIGRRSALDNVLTGRLRTMPLWRIATRSFAQADILRAQQALASVGLAGYEWRRADTLSGGQQQRVAIARAIAQESRVLLADEPVASLDLETAIIVMTLMASLARESGMGVLCSLHQTELARRFADRTLIIDGGRLIDSH